MGREVSSHASNVGYSGGPVKNIYFCKEIDRVDGCSSSRDREQWRGALFTIMIFSNLFLGFIYTFFNKKKGIFTSLLFILNLNLVKTSLNLLFDNQNRFLVVLVLVSMSESIDLGYVSLQGSKEGKD